MKVKRIVCNIETEDTMAVKYFYQDLLGLDLLMDHGWHDIGSLKLIQ